MKFTARTSLMALAVASAFVLPAPTFAQATGDSDTPEADAQEGVEEILVTATRREENLQDIPLSVATVSDETLAAINSGGADIRGLSGRVPSLNIESSAVRSRESTSGGSATLTSTSTLRSRSAWSMTRSSLKTRS